MASVLFISAISLNVHLLSLDSLAIDQFIHNSNFAVWLVVVRSLIFSMAGLDAPMDYFVSFNFNLVP
jgi:hypothetical protein